MRSSSQNKITNLTFGLVLSFLIFSWGEVCSQTTFTENAAAYGLNLNRNKDGGHAWSDFDGDGDLDVLVLENQNGSVKSFLMRNTAFVEVEMFRL